MEVIYINTMRMQFFNLQVTLFCYSHFTKYTFLTFFRKKICTYQKKLVPLHRN